jgi:tetratricopeptide (TPR) repeat protein
MCFNNSVNSFNLAWEVSIAKFKSISGWRSLDIDLKYSKNNENNHSMTLFEKIPDIYKQWQEIISSWDRQSLLFSVIYTLVREDMKPWQIANYFIADRNPFEAFEILQEASSDNWAEDYPPHCAALAKSLCSLTYYEESLEWAEKAYEEVPNNHYFETILADAYFLTDRTEEASKVYKSRISLVPPSLSDSISDMFLETFSIEKGVVPSPIFAIQFGQQLSDSRQSKEFWKLAEAEFYYSPYFRSHHAYSLASKGQVNECLAKLIALVQEMPWLQEASLNLKCILDYFNQKGNRIMPDFQNSLSKQIQDRGWTSEGMFILQIQD